jgi:hypothetical protein
MRIPHIEVDVLCASIINFGSKTTTRIHHEGGRVDSHIYAFLFSECFL